MLAAWFFPRPIYCTQCGTQVRYIDWIDDDAYMMQCRQCLTPLILWVDETDQQQEEAELCA